MLLEITVFGLSAMQCAGLFALSEEWAELQMRYTDEVAVCDKSHDRSEVCETSRSFLQDARDNGDAIDAELARKQCKREGSPK